MKEIEEMAKKICGRDYATCLDCVNETKRIIKHANINECECYCYAKKFYNAGYRKVGDEYEVIKGYLPYTKKLEAAVRKETAKELFVKIEPTITTHFYGSIEEDITANLIYKGILAVFKNYGVEIEGE